MSDVPPLVPPPDEPNRWWERSAWKAAIVAFVLGIFAVLRVIRSHETDAVTAWLNFADETAKNILAAWLGVTAAGPSKSAR